jgi:uncharacterized protein YkwD
MRAMSRERSRLVRPSLVLAALIAALAAMTVGPVAHPAPVSAGTASNMEAKILGWINDARARRDIKPLRVTDKLRNLAGDRAAELARTGDLEHPDCLSCLLNSRDISWDRCGEVIAMNSGYDWGHDAARAVFESWRNSAPHWDLLMSRSFRRIGLGVAYRSQDDSTWAAGILAG